MIRTQSWTVVPSSRTLSPPCLGRCGTTHPSKSWWRTAIASTTSINAIYDHTARNMELMARLSIAQDGKHVLVKHNYGDSPFYLKNHPEAAAAPTKRQRQPSRFHQPEPAASEAPEPASSSSARPTEPLYPPPHVSEDIWTSQKEAVKAGTLDRGVRDHKATTASGTA